MSNLPNNKQDGTVKFTDKETLRAQARQDISEGPVTHDYSLNVEESIKHLNESLATELVCVMRYNYHYFMATGINSGSVADEFLEHANQEYQHALKIAERIQQLGGKPDFNPDTLTKRSHAEYKEGQNLVDMIREDLIAERIAVSSYRELAEYFGHKDPTSRRMIEAILEQEEEHANDMADILFALDDTVSGDEHDKLYSKAEKKDMKMQPSNGAPNQSQAH